jgi:threonine dehydratase
MSIAPNPSETDLSSRLSQLPVSIDDVRAARERIMGHLRRTPVLESVNLSSSSGYTVSFKAENLQRTGSFKARGALNALMLLNDEQRARGVVTFSAGNHGAGLAFAASILGVSCSVFMASTAVQAKVDAIRNYGANVVFGETINDALAAMERAIKEEGRTYLSPFDDRGVVAGQGVAGLELLEDAPETDAIVVPMGGGGLIAGISLVVKSLRPEITVIGIEPEGAPTISKSLEAGHPVTLDSVSTIADGLAAPFAGTVTQEIITACVDRVALVSDQDIADAIAPILSRTKLLPEPAGAASFAGLINGKTGIPAGSRVVCLLSGGNISLDRLKAFL